MVFTADPLSGDDGWRALEDIARKRELTRAESGRQAISEAVEGERRRDLWRRLPRLRTTRMTARRATA
jgi:hypothetical protein